jgi:hypothetical protein
MMNDLRATVRTVLENAFAAQISATAAWHECETQEAHCLDEHSLENLSCLVLAQHRWNFLLWHVEDAARRKDVPDSVIAQCKRRVDTLNQQRNDAMEKVDLCLYHILAPFLPAAAATRQNTETAGMALDRLSILALKIYHMEEQTRRTDAGEEHISSCKDKLRVLKRQREDLCRAVLELADDYLLGNKMISLYLQFKMYNDPSLNPELYAQRPK